MPERTSRFDELARRAMVLLLFINPFIDILNGIFMFAVQKLTGADFGDGGPSVTPALLFRMLLLVCMAAYILYIRHRAAIGLMLCIGLSFALSVAGEIIYIKPAGLFSDAAYFARFIHNLLLLIVFGTVITRSRLPRRAALRMLNQAASFTAGLLSLGIILPYMLGTGIYTYGDRFGYRGNRGFFYAGNEITAVLMLLLPLTIYIFLVDNPRRRKYFTTRRDTVMYWTRRAFYCLPPALTICALIVLGTRTAFIAAAAAPGLIGLYCVVAAIRTKKTVWLKRCGAIVLATLAVFAVIIIAVPDFLRDVSDSIGYAGLDIPSSGFVDAALHGRQEKLRETFADYTGGGAFVWLFGIGRGSMAETIEMDLFEVVFYYGIVGAVFMLALYAAAGVWFIKTLRRDWRLPMYSLAVALAMGVGYLVIAGHVLFSVTAGFYLVFLIIYSRLAAGKASAEVLPG